MAVNYLGDALPIRYELIDKDGKVFPCEFENATDAVLHAVRMWPDQEQDCLRQGQGWDIQAISRNAPVCQKCKSPLAVKSIMGTHGLCEECVPSGFKRTISEKNSEIKRLRKALKECAMRCRYDGDLFHDQGNEMRRDASWRAADMAKAALAPADGGWK